MNLNSVVDDPNQSNSKRTEIMRDAGLEKATGVKFDVIGIGGMVVLLRQSRSQPKATDRSCA